MKRDLSGGWFFATVCSGRFGRIWMNMVEYVFTDLIYVCKIYGCLNSLATLGGLFFHVMFSLLGGELQEVSKVSKKI